MNLDLFNKSLSQQAPLPGSSVYQQALWYAAKHNWDEAHTLVQDLDDANAAWIHGYLHWQEGDISNADYWYRRAGRKRPCHSLQEELHVLVSSIA